ncbi:MAG: hypothetical protein ABSF14_08205 [Terriglobia bacterium]
MKARPIYDAHSVGLVVIPEEDGRGKDPLEALNYATIVEAIFGKVKEIEDLGSGVETNYTGLLFERQGSDPNWDQAVLAVGEAEARVCPDLQEEAAVASGMRRLAERRTAKWKTAEDKGSCVVGEFLPILVPLLADELNGLELLESPLGDANVREQRP